MADDIAAAESALPPGANVVPLCALGGGRFELVALDRRRTGLGTALRMTRYGPIVGVDEGGPARQYLPFVVDTLPNLLRAPANVDLGSRATGGGSSRRQRVSVASAGNIVLSFGGDDPAHLSERLVAALLRWRVWPAARLLIVAGPRFGTRRWPAGVRVVRAPQQLAPIIANAAVVFTSFGLTCFEALSAGVPVVLLNPSRYHRRLGRHAGLPEIGVGRPRRRKLHATLSTPVVRPRPATPPAATAPGPPDHAAPESGSVGVPAPQPQAQLAGLLRSLDPRGPRCCPGCGRRLNPVVERFAAKTYYRCRRCRLLYMVGFGAQRQYDKDYFFADYQRQYGKTYLEDFAHIRAMGMRRLRAIERVCVASKTSTRSLRLLDVGCAYGPFLHAARSRGWQPIGIDVAAEAVAYVRQLGIVCHRASFEDDVLPDSGRLDALCMWYVIEHFADLSRVLNRVAGMLPEGGVFAFSTPNGAGVSSRRSRRRFLLASPDDHYTVWSPGAARRVLRRYGMRVQRISVTGHHPERLPLLGSERWGVLRPVVRWWAAIVSRAFRLGDTFEVYAVRVADSAPAHQSGEVGSRHRGRSGARSTAPRATNVTVGAAARGVASKVTAAQGARTWVLR